MSTLTVTYPGTLGALRTWLRTVSAVSALVGTRVWVGGLPKSPATPVLPAVVLTRVGGSYLAPVDEALVQIDCWAATGDAAETLAATVAAALDSAAGSTSLTSGVRLVGATVGAAQWLPDPTSDTPRYLVTAQVVTAATS